LSAPKKRQSGWLKKPKPPPRPYYAYLNILDYDPADYQLTRLKRKLTSCASFQLATTGRIGSNKFGFPNKICNQQECCYCRYIRKGQEARKFSLAKHPLSWCMDRLQNSGFGETLRLFSVSFFTINIRAYRIDANPDEIVKAGVECRSFIRETIGKAQKILGYDDIGLFGHLEASSPKSGADLDRYLIGDNDPVAIYTVLHFHGWVVSTAMAERIREMLVELLHDGVPQPHRICFRDRQYETQDFHVSISEVLDYGVKHLHSIKAEAAFENPQFLFFLSRFRKYLRGDGLRGTRIAVNLKAMEKKAGALWAAHRPKIYSEIERIGYTAFARMPKSLRIDYDQWKQSERIRLGQQKLKEWLLEYNNWCDLNSAETLAFGRSFYNGTRFCRSCREYCGFWSRAPPVARNLWAVNPFLA